MSTPDPRRTEDAVRDVRTVFPRAEMHHFRLGSLLQPYVIYTRPMMEQGAVAIAGGDTPKAAWWNARLKALAAALER